MSSMSKCLKGGMVACGIAAMSFTAMDAQANLLNNPGFEAELQPFVSVDEEWNAFSSGGATAPLPDRNTVAPHSGLQHLELVTGAVNEFSGAFQWERGITAGDEYTFSFWARGDGNALEGVLEYRIEWITLFGGEDSRSFINDPSSVLTNEYQLFTVSGIAPAAAVDLKATVAFATFNASGTGTGTVYVDDTSLVPEPASMALLTMGGLALLRRRN